MAGFEHKKHWREMALCSPAAISASRIRVEAQEDPHLKHWQFWDLSRTLVCIALQFQLTINLMALETLATRFIAHSCLHCSAVPVDYQPGSAGGGLCGGGDHRGDPPQCAAAAVGQPHHGRPGCPW